MYEVRILTFDGKMSKDKIEKECNSIAKARNEYGAGLPCKIQWLDKIFDTKKEACDYIEKIDRDCVQLAVKFLEYPDNIEPSKKMLSLKERYEKEIAKACDYTEKHSIKTFKAALVGCPNCGSKLNKDFVVGEKCPLCKTDLRSKTTLETLAKYKQNAEELQKQYQEEEKKNKLKYKKKAKEMWLVKIDYHC